MALNNTYERQVRANPTALNPNQRYVEQYDAAANLSEQINRFGQTALNLAAKADNQAAYHKTKQQFDNRELDRQDMKRRVELNQNPRAREAEYQKGLKAINKKYDKDVDPRWQKEYDSWVELADKKDLQDYERQIVEREATFAMNHAESEIEYIRNGQKHILIMALVSYKVNIKTLIEKLIVECNQYGNFLSKTFTITNVKEFTDEEIEEIINKDEDKNGNN